jgi:ribosomal protein S20
MAITKGGKKAHRQSLVKKVYNDRRINKVKEIVKVVRANVAEKNKTKAIAELKNAYQALDKAAKRGVIKKRHRSPQEVSLGKSNC